MSTFTIPVALMLLSTVVYNNKVDCKNTDTDESDWVDPLDMIYYDPSTKTMTNRKSVMDLVVDDIDSTVTENVLLDVEKIANDLKSVIAEVDASIDVDCPHKLNKLQLEISTLNETVYKLNMQLGSCTALNEQNFFRQYVQSLVKRFRNFAEQSGGHYIVDIKLNNDQFRYLQGYNDDGRGSVQEIHTILLAMLSNIKWLEDVDLADEDKQTWPEFTSQYLDAAVKVAGIMFLMTASLFISLHVPRSIWWISTRLLLVSFVVSVPWNWWHLYKKEIAIKHASMLKEMPESCRTNSPSFWSMIRYLFRGDECGRYYENLHVDPMWEVPPTKAIAVTVTKFFLEPAQHIGGAINKLMVAAFTDLPFHLWIPVFVMILLLIAFFFFFCFRYRIRTLLFNIEPDHNVQAAARDNADHVQNLTNTIEQLRVRLNERIIENETLNQQLQQTRNELSAIESRRYSAPIAASSHGEGDRERAPVAGSHGEGNRERAPIAASSHGEGDRERAPVAGSHGEGNRERLPIAASSHGEEDHLVVRAIEGGNVKFPVACSDHANGPACEQIDLDLDLVESDDIVDTIDTHRSAANEFVMVEP